MKVYKVIDLQQEIEIDLTAEDIHLAFTMHGLLDVHTLKRELVTIYQFLKGLPEEMINQLETDTRERIYEVLSEQINRFK